MYHLIKRKLICKPKDRGALTIKNLDKMNVSMLCKMVQKVENDEELWQDIIQAKYLQHRPIALVQHRQSGFACSGDLFKVRYLYLENRHMRVGNG
jgi:hypothetical protein